ncbi:MAG: hypothetical protein EBR83_11065, partial [Verrucomicrobia bacterium]|nr:hypothetical protein [Verrucomicrobiota bacterium]
MLPEARQKELKAFAEKLADIARRVLVAAHARVDTEVEFKSDGTPVTAKDVKWSFDRAVTVGG